MERNKIFFILGALLTFYLCISMKNPEKPYPVYENEGSFFKVKDGTELFIYDYQPLEKYQISIFIISGITGINHNNEHDIIERLSNNENRIVVIHPRGTGYSDGKRGDISNFEDFINDYIEIISNDKDYLLEQHKIILYGHSMSTAISLAITDKLDNISGIILVNPPYMMKKAKGMTPGFSQYIKYVWYFLFEKHKPIVNMAGDPDLIENEEDRKESQSRVNDSLLVKYFSMYYMLQSRKTMNRMIDYSRKAYCPLLLVYGMKDNIVDKKGCDTIFKEWHHENKQLILIENGTHGKSTVISATDTIIKWMQSL